MVCALLLQKCHRLHFQEEPKLSNEARHTIQFALYASGLFHIMNVLMLLLLFWRPEFALYHISAQKYVNYGIEQSKYAKIREEASRHSLYEIIPRHREQIEWYDVPHWTAWA